MKIPHVVLLVAIAAACACVAPSASGVAQAGARSVERHREFTATVASVADGDTATFVVSGGSARGTRIKVRFAGIDAPETAHTASQKGQPHGESSKRLLMSLLAVGDARIVVIDTDRYGRLVSLVYVRGQLVNAVLVRAGLAYAYRDYLRDLPADAKAAILAAEERAMRERVGVWADGSAESPSDYRRRTKRTGS